MSFWSIWFWFVLVLFFEILLTKYVIYAFSIVFCLILSMSGFLFSFEYDLLASMVLLTYSSVFILLSLLLIQFSSLSGLSSRSNVVNFSSFFWVFFFIMLWSIVNPVYINTTSWFFSIIWQDLLGLGGDEFFHSNTVAHTLLYKFFIFETIWSNIFLILSFIVYSFLLKIRSNGNINVTSKQGTFLLNNMFWKKKWSSLQVRGVHHVRRQSRRLNSSLVYSKF